MRVLCVLFIITYFMTFFAVYVLDARFRLVYELQFEWDEDKATQILRSMAFRFSPLPRYSRARSSRGVDDREDYGELPLIALGRVETEIYRVAYTWRGEKVIQTNHGAESEQI